MQIDGLGGLAAEQGEYARAQELHEESLALRREQSDTRDISESLRRLGEVVLLQGDYARAEVLLEESLQLLREVATKADIAGALHTLGVVKLAQGDDTRARTLFTESLLIRQEISDHAGIAECIEGFAALAAGNEQHHEAGFPHPHRAARLLGAAAALRAVIGTPLPSIERPAYDRHLAAARARLDEAAWTAAWGEGQHISLEQAIAYALDQQRPSLELCTADAYYGSQVWTMRITWC